MAEVQSHGNDFEDLKIQELTGISKKEYDKLKSNGYTSPFDLVKGIIVNYNGSIKSTGQNSINCSDILKRMEQTEYTFIVGCYKQKGNNKVFHTEYKFYILPEHYKLLWGDMKYELIEQYVNKIKSIEKGRAAQKKYQLVKNQWKSEVKCNKALFIINPKVDSKEQRRVQCSIGLDKLLSSGIKYTKKDINIIIESSRRKFNK